MLYEVITDAFMSPNYPVLAKTGIDIKLFEDRLWRNNLDFLITHTDFCSDIAILKFFPGMSTAVVKAISSINGLKGLVIETYGSGNAPTDPKIIDALKTAVITSYSIHYTKLYEKGDGIHDADGKIIRMAGSHTDITKDYEEKQVVQKLLAETELLIKSSGNLLYDEIAQNIKEISGASYNFV